MTPNIVPMAITKTIYKRYTKENKKKIKACHNNEKSQGNTKTENIKRGIKEL